MSSDVDPLDEGQPRDWRHRPQIIPLTRGKPNLKAKLTAYTRASTFSKALDDGGGLSTWQKRHAAVGIACNPDLAAMVAALGRNVNAYTRDDKQNLDAIIERAHDRSGGNEKADYGTAVHSLTEPERADADPLAIDDGMARDVTAYELMLDALDADVVDTERFVVNDELRVAGTFDHTIKLRSPLVFEDVTIPAGTVLAVDKKTGRLSLGAHAIQLAVYARAHGYDHVTGERTALDVSPQWGIVAHVPRGEGKAAAYVVDLHAGWKAAKLAADVRAFRASQRKLGTLAVEAAAPAVNDVVGRIVDVVDQGDAVVVRAELDDSGNGAVPSATEPANTRSDVEPEPHADPAAVIEAAAIELLQRELGAVPIAAPSAAPIGNDPILAAIKAATSRDECAALWREHEARGAWQAQHTEAVRARLAELPAA